MSWVAGTPQTTWRGEGECPEYYRIPVLGSILTPFDIIEALALNFNLGCVVKYVLRAGRKAVDGAFVWHGKVYGEQKRKRRAA